MSARISDIGYLVAAVEALGARNVHVYREHNRDRINVDLGADTDSAAVQIGDALGLGPARLQDLGDGRALLQYERVIDGRIRVVVYGPPRAAAGRAA